MHLAFTTLDVFTDTPLSGNPLAIVRVPSSLRVQLTEDIKQKIATEFNLSETVFLHEVSLDEHQANYDIFSAKARIAFAGHPTIGTAIYVKAVSLDSFRSVTKLNTLAGDVKIEFNARTGMATVGVPHNFHEHSYRLPHPLPGPSTNSSRSDTVPIISIVKGMAFNLVPLANLDTLGTVSQGLLPLPDIYKGEYLDNHDGWNQGFHGTLYYVDLTVRSNDAAAEMTDVRILRTRSIGHREDPGTGSASAALSAYLSLMEPKGRGAGPFLYHLIQGVEMGRQCDIHVSVWRTIDGSTIESIDLTGSAVKVMEGAFEVNV